MMRSKLFLKSIRFQIRKTNIIIPFSFNFHHFNFYEFFVEKYIKSIGLSNSTFAFTNGYVNYKTDRHLNSRCEDYSSIPTNVFQNNV